MSYETLPKCSRQFSSASALRCGSDAGSESVAWMFPYRHGGLSSGSYDSWMTWDGSEHKPIGRLPPDLRSLEHELVWSAGLLEERMATGINPYSEAG